MPSGVQIAVAIGALIDQADCRCLGEPRIVGVVENERLSFANGNNGGTRQTSWWGQRVARDRGDAVEISKTFTRKNTHSPVRGASWSTSSRDDRSNFELVSTAIDASFIACPAEQPMNEN